MRYGEPVSLEHYPQENSQPESDDADIWRFMPFDRFVELMETGELFFCRADKFEDEHEVCLPGGLMRPRNRRQAARQAGGLQHGGAVRQIQSHRSGFGREGVVATSKRKPPLRFLPTIPVP
jgi:hypothetical protein